MQPARLRADDQSKLVADTLGHAISAPIVDAPHAREVLVETSTEVAQEVVERNHSLDEELCMVALLSVKTHRQAATGNTRSREAPGTAGGSRSLGQRPRSPAHALA
jgi:hypothetical protein